MKPVFRIDLLSAVSGLCTLVTGIMVHRAGHFSSHEVWHNWSVAHVITSIVFTAVIIIHIKQHRNWFAGLLKKSSLRRETAIVVTVAFLAAALSGIYLLIFVEGQGSHAGIVHYAAGIILGICAAGHIAKRWSALAKGAFGAGKKPKR